MRIQIFKKAWFCYAGFLFFFAFFLVGFFTPGYVSAATFSLGPTTGTFTIGSTFDVSVFLDTQGEPVNTIVVFLKFPADKVQLVSPSTGESIIDIWLTAPKFNNQTGIVELKGGIPGGINVSRGLVTKLTFRAKSPGSAIFKFQDGSEILLNDGLGTEALQHTESAVYNFILPPPEGPTIVSPTHPEQSKWYQNKTVVTQWKHDDGVTGYSYILDNEINSIPDDISEGMREEVIYKNLSDGQHYFHVKSLRRGIWGGVTHFAINIDATPPAEFPIEISPEAKTSRQQPVIIFSTTDRDSGISYYELKVVPLHVGGPENAELPKNGNQSLFVEADSPYLLSFLDLGSYDVIVRAYDKAGNYRESVKNLKIVSTIFRFIEDKGIEIKGIYVLPWLWLWIFCGLVLTLLIMFIFYLRHSHRQLEHQKTQNIWPDKVKTQLEELKKYREKYGKVLVILLVAGSILLSGTGVFAQEVTNTASDMAEALEQSVTLNPPLITTFSKNISNDEIFYIGGKTDSPSMEVIIYIQCLQTGETSSHIITSDSKGDWFYRHKTFLSTGNYLLWAQSRVGGQLSPPGPQVVLSVQPTALQFGASRISYETLYLGLLIAFFAAFAVLFFYAIFYASRVRAKRKQFNKEVKEAEESLRRGFAVLRRDIEAELAVVKEAKMNKELAEEVKEKEAQLLKDLEQVENYIGKEIFDIEKVEFKG